MRRRPGRQRRRRRKRLAKRERSRRNDRGPKRGPISATFLPMRVAAAILVLACTGWAQFKSTAPLVVAPTTVTDSKGRYVDGLTPEDLILYDNNVPQAIHMDWMMYPIDLVVAVQTSSNSGAVIDKLGGTGILFTQLLAADAGETAVISFSDEVKVHQDFTGSPDLVIHALRMLRKEGGDAHLLDALREALLMLERRPPPGSGGILSVALSVRIPSPEPFPAVSRHAALWRPDFPPVSGRLPIRQATPAIIPFSVREHPIRLTKIRKML